MLNNVVALKRTLFFGAIAVLLCSTGSLCGVAAASLDIQVDAISTDSSNRNELVCVNGGKLVDGTCVCPIYYTGEDCHERQCPNSINGGGPYSILPVNPQTQICDHCDEVSYKGLGCQLCQRDEACRRHGDSRARCNRGIAVRGNNKQFQCNLNSPFFLRLMGDGNRNISAQILLNCSTEDGKAFIEGDSGACSMAIYRMEPDEEYVDPFFRCEAKNCSMRAVEIESAADADDSDESLLKRFFNIVRVSGQVSLVTMCALLALLGVFSNYLTYRTMRRLTFTLTTCITVTVVMYILLMVVSMRPINPEVAIGYECKHTSCACAEDPPKKYTPICSESSVLVDQIFPSIKNSIRFMCGTNSRECKLTLTDLTLVFDATCDASECVVEEDYPLDPTNGGSGASSASARRRQTIVSALFALALLTCLGVVGHYFWLRSRTEYRNKEFGVLFQLLNRPEEVSFAGDVDQLQYTPPPPLRRESMDSNTGLRHSSSNAAITPRGTQDFFIESPAPIPPSGEGNGDIEDYEDNDGVHGADERAQLLPRRSSFANSEDARASVVTVRASAVRHAANMTLAELAEVDRIRQLTRTPLSLAVTDLQYVLRGSALHSDDTAFTRGGGGNSLLPNVDGRVILHRINFSVHSGEVLAMMGPSGAGKTTLLDLLSARVKSGDVSGSIRLNGTAISTMGSRGRRYRNIIGYVSQEDTMLPALTVRQTIEYAARLKLPTAFSPRTIRRIVNRMIHVLKLKQCEGTLIGDGTGLRGISGGEKRRVSIAVELLANPRILFLDEPTSGLDTVSAKRVVEAVVELAKDSTMRCYAPHYFSFKPIVIFSIHQPSQEIYELFDKILLLSHGMSVYCGPAAAASATLEERVAASFGQTRIIPHRSDHSNPAEYLMKLEEILDDHARAQLLEEDTHANTVAQGYARAGVTRPPPADRNGGEAADEDEEFFFSASAADGEAILEVTAGFRKYYANVYQQLGLLVSRSVTSIITSFSLVMCHAAVVACLATLMCFLYREQELDLPGALNRAGSVTFLLLVTSFVSLSCLEQLIVERKLFIVERENGFYSTFPYLLSKVFVDIIPLRVIPAVVLASVIYFPMGYRVDDGSHFFWFIVVVVLFSICMTLIILCLGIISGTFGAAALLSSVCILWNFVFGGFMVQAETMPQALRPFKSLSPFFLAFESLMVNELNDQNCVFSPTDETGKQSEASIPILCVQYLANVGLKPDRFSSDIMQLGLYCFLLFVVAWVLLVTCAKLVR